jgi:hypothetical protein
MLERILSSHPQIHGGPEPHLLTPLAHLGVWANVDRAPYDHIVAALGQKDFVERLPHKDEDYYAACRAYCDTLYSRYMESSGKRVCLDKTPEYATILPYLSKVYPDGKYVVLTRHPVAVFSSFATSFFDGNFETAHAHDPLLERYVPVMAGFLRQSSVPHLHVRYEDLVADPEAWVEKVYAHIGVPNAPETIDYGQREPGTAGGLGDPIGVQKHTRPSVESLGRWADELVADPKKRDLMQRVVAKLDPRDLATLGYPLETFWEPLEKLGAKAPRKKKSRKLDRYALERKAIVHGRTLVQHSLGLRNIVKTVRLACEVLLREY